MEGWHGRAGFESQGGARAERIAAAAMAAAAGMLGGNAASAGLFIDLRVESVSGGSATIVDDKHVTYSAGTVTVVMNVIARVLGVNATQLFADVNGNAIADTRNDDSVQIVSGSFQSVGSLLGNMTTGASGADATPTTRVAPFNSFGSLNGVARDWDSDGDLDIGTAGTDLTFMYSARAMNPVFATRLDGTTDGWYNFATTGTNSNDRVLDATTSELQIGTIRFITSGVGAGSTNINFVRRPTSDAGSALWFEDNLATGKTPGNGGYLTGQPVLVNVGVVPEPAAGVIAASTAALTLLARKWKRGRSGKGDAANLRASRLY
jgi:hypothetical protein